MERIWIITAGCCVIIAAALLFLGKYDGAFVTGAIGIVAWFLDVRNRLSKKQRLTENVSNPKRDRTVKQDDE